MEKKGDKKTAEHVDFRTRRQKRMGWKRFFWRFFLFLISSFFLPRLCIKMHQLLGGFCPNSQTLMTKILCSFSWKTTFSGPPSSSNKLRCQVVPVTTNWGYSWKPSLVILKAYCVGANVRIVLDGENQKTNVMCESPYHLSWWEVYPNCLTVFLPTKMHHFLGR